MSFLFLTATSDIPANAPLKSTLWLPGIMTSFALSLARKLSARCWRSSTATRY